MEVIKNIEDISDSIFYNNKIKFEYWKYVITNKLEKQLVSNPIVSPYAIVYNKQEFYLIGIKDGQDKFYHYRLDRIKNLKKLNDKITVKKTKSQIKDFAESTVEMFGGKKEEVEAICNICLLDAVFDIFGKNITIEKIQDDDENFKLIVDTNTLGFKMWAMRNIDLVEVVRPITLRKEMKSVIEKAKNRYDK
jgi:predicted DNA-binding transcriptional regulator YafY